MPRVKHRFVYICSPYRGDTEKNIQKAQEYCKEAMSLWPDVIPVAPHVYFTQFLDDDDPADQRKGLEAAEKLLDMCDEIWVFGMDNPTESMRREIAYAEEHKIPIRNTANIFQYGYNPGPEPGDFITQITTSKSKDKQEAIKLSFSLDALERIVKGLRRADGKDLTLDFPEYLQEKSEETEENG